MNGFVFVPARAWAFAGCVWSLSGPRPSSSVAEAAGSSKACHSTPLSRPARLTRVPLLGLLTLDTTLQTRSGIIYTGTATAM